MTEPQTLPAENVFGIAKKMHLELEKLTLVDHGAVISMVNSMAQRREMAEKLERQQAQMQMQQQQQAANDAAIQEAIRAQERQRQERLADKMKAHLAQQPITQANVTNEYEKVELVKQ